MGFAELPGVHDLHVDGKRVRCQVDAAGLDGLLAHLTPFGVRSLTSHPPTLEDLFLRHHEAGEREAQQTGQARVAR